MHGSIFLQFQRFAQKQGCLTDWENLLREAQLPIKSYSPARAYPDEEMLALIGAASRFLNIPAGAVLEAFGEFVAPELIRLYGRLIEPECRVLVGPSAVQRAASPKELSRASPGTMARPSRSPRMPVCFAAIRFALCKLRA